MKKFLLIALVAVMAVSLMACGQQAAPAASSAAGGDTAASSAPAAAGNANYPGKKQISLIVPFSAGGASDTVSRIYAQELAKALPGTVTVSNVTGASGSVGLQKVRSSKADGYTIGYIPPEAAMLSALGFSDITTGDFKMIGRASKIPAAVTVRADSPWNTFEEFITYAKEHPGEIQVGNSGTGAIWHIAARALEDATGAEFTHVPFEGATPAVNALLGSNIQAVTVSPAEVKTQVEDGTFRVLAVLGSEPSAVVPDVPISKDLGIDVVVEGFGAFGVPKDTPQEIVDILVAASDTAINSQEVKDLLDQRGFNFAFANGPDTDAYVAEQQAYYDDLIPKLNIANS